MHSDTQQLSYSKNLKHKKKDSAYSESFFCVLSKNALKLNKNISILKGETPLTSLSYINNFDLSTLFTADEGNIFAIMCLSRH